MGASHLTQFAVVGRQVRIINKLKDFSNPGTMRGDYAQYIGHNKDGPENPFAVTFWECL